VCSSPSWPVRVEIKLRCERKAGAIFLSVPREQGKRTDSTSSQSDSKLQEMAESADVPMPTVFRRQLEASLPEEQFEQHVKTTKDAAKELTSASVLRLAQKVQPKPETPAAVLPKGARM